MNDFGKDVIAPFWQDVIDRIKDNLVQSGHNASGNTLQAIENPIFTTVGDNTYRIELVMPSYYAYLDQGVKGVKNKKRNTGLFKFRDKMPPLFAMRKMMYYSGLKAKRLKGKWGSMGYEESMNQYAWAIARSIYNKGLEQTDFYSDVVNDQLIDNFAKVLLDELGRDVLIKIDL